MRLKMVYITDLSDKIYIDGGENFSILVNTIYVTTEVNLGSANLGCFHTFDTLAVYDGIELNNRHA